MIMAIDPGSQNLAWGMYDPVTDMVMALELEDLRDRADVDKMKANKAQKGKDLIARKKHDAGMEKTEETGKAKPAGRRPTGKAPRAKISVSERAAVLERMKDAYEQHPSKCSSSRLTSVIESQQRTGHFQAKVRQVDEWFKRALREANMGDVAEEPSYKKFERLGVTFPKGTCEKHRKERKVVSREYVDAWMVSEDGRRRTTAAVRDKYMGRCKRDDMADVVMMLLARAPSPPALK